MNTAWWLLIVWAALCAGTVFGWCWRVALTRAQEDVREITRMIENEPDYPKLKVLP